MAGRALDCHALTGLLLCCTHGSNRTCGWVGLCTCDRPTAVQLRFYWFTGLLHSASIALLRRVMTLVPYLCSAVMSPSIAAVWEPRNFSMLVLVASDSVLPSSAGLGSMLSAATKADMLDFLGSHTAVANGDTIAEHKYGTSVTTRLRSAMLAE